MMRRKQQRMLICHDRYWPFSRVSRANNLIAPRDRSSRSGRRGNDRRVISETLIKIAYGVAGVARNGSGRRDPESRDSTRGIPNA